MEPSVSTGMSFPLIPTYFILQERPSWFREHLGSERLRNCGVAAASLRKGLEQQESLVLLENRDREAAGGHPGNTRPLEWSSRCQMWVVQGSGTSSAPGKCKIQGFLSQRSGPSQQIQRRSSSCAPRLSPALQQRFPGEKQNFGIHTHSSKPGKSAGKTPSIFGLPAAISFWFCWGATPGFCSLVKGMKSDF